MGEFQLPHITGETVEEQVRQIIAYLRQTALQLQALPPEGAEKEETETVRRSCSFPALRVRDHIQLGGDLNGVYMENLRLWGASSFQLQSRFREWSGTGGQRQTVLLSGSSGGTPVLGIILVTDAGQCRWEGSGTVTVSCETGGVIRVKLPVTCFDHWILQSPQPFHIL